MDCYVYVLGTLTGNRHLTYVGWTDDVARRLAQHNAFILALQNAGVPTTVLDSTELEHADLTTLVGAPGDTKVTPALMDFLLGCFKG